MSPWRLKIEPWRSCAACFLTGEQHRTRLQGVLEEGVIEQGVPEEGVLKQGVLEEGVFEEECVLRIV